MQPEPIQYVGPLTHFDTPEHRRGEPRLSESMLQSLMQSCNMSNNLRSAPPSIFRPHYMRTRLPVSSLGAYGAAPSGHTLPHTAPFPLEPVQRVSEAIRLAAEARAQHRAQREEQQQLSSPTRAEPQTPTPTTPTPRGAVARLPPRSPLKRYLIFMKEMTASARFARKSLRTDSGCVG